MQRQPNSSFLSGLSWLLTLAITATCITSLLIGCAGGNNDAPAVHGALHPKCENVTGNLEVPGTHCYPEDGQVCGVDAPDYQHEATDPDGNRICVHSEQPTGCPQGITVLRQLAVDGQSVICHIRAVNCPEGFIEEGDDPDPNDGIVICRSCETLTYYLDRDGDGHGGGDKFEACKDKEPAGYILVGGDCDDSRRDVAPTAAEVCDFVDNNCDGDTDEGFEGIGTECTHVNGSCQTPGLVSCKEDRTGVICLPDPNEDPVCDDPDPDAGPDAQPDADPNPDADPDMGPDGEPDMVELNECGGNTALEGNVDDPCDRDVDNNVVICGTLQCDGLDALVCTAGETNGCNGCNALPEELGATCGPCNDGEVVCAGNEDTACSGASELNACGECGPVPPERCNNLIDDDCDGRTDEDTEEEPCQQCEDDLPVNECGGCVMFNSVVGEPCDIEGNDVIPCGSMQCNGPDALRCVAAEGSDALDQSCTLGNGVCRAGGVFVCSDERTVVCNAQPGEPEEELTDQELACDERDNDCDNEVDEGCSCTDGDTRQCGAGIGVCIFGEQTCVNGTYEDQPCLDEDDNVIPEPGDLEESCDGLDNDCDGLVDNRLSPPLNPLQEGVCRNTRQICDGENGFVDSYPPTYENGPEEQSCDGLDNNCDGVIDNGGLGTFGTQCDTGEPGICQEGRIRCAGDGFVCQPVRVPAQNEICDGLDNDCDGDVDENIQAVGTPCNTGEPGICDPGRLACAHEDPEADQNGFVCEGNIIPGERVEICDGQDNNCDGQEDEGCDCRPGQTQVCGVNEGICTRGTQRCSELGTFDGQPCLDGNNQPVVLPGTEEEVCNGVDDNCDGETDEVAPPPNPLQAGVCAGTSQLCDGFNGLIVNYPGTFEEEEVTCDGLDNDCDGGIDEDLTNQCGGCGPLPVDPFNPNNTFEEGAFCGACGTFECQQDNTGICNDPGTNACDGCAELPETPNTPCGGECGRFECDGLDAVVCNDPGQNDCGGCQPLNGTLNASCGPCNGGTLVCNGNNNLRCNNENAGLNICGVCGPAPQDAGLHGTSCSDGEGACQVQGVHECNEDGDQVICPAQATEPPEPGEELTCDDGVDNDCDGQTDDADSDCAGGVACEQGICPDHPLGWTPSCNDLGFCEYQDEQDPLLACIYVHAGTSFLIGSPNNEPGRRVEEGPQIRITFAEGFCIGKFEATVGQYSQCNGCGDPFGDNLPTDPSFPQTGIDKAQARAFALSMGATLPSEAQWEYAAGGDDERFYPYGNDDPDCTRVNMDEGNGPGCGTNQLDAVDTRPAGRSFIGAYNMSGNAFEWTEDCGRNSRDHTPPFPTDGSARTACPFFDQYGAVWKGGSLTSRGDTTPIQPRVSYLALNGDDSFTDRRFGVRFVWVF